MLEWRNQQVPGVVMQSLLRGFVLVFVIDPLSELCHLLLIMWQETQEQESALVSKARQSVIWNDAQMYKEHVFVCACRGRDSV